MSDLASVEKGGTMNRDYLQQKTAFFNRKRMRQGMMGMVAMILSICLSSCGERAATSDYLFYVQNDEIQYVNLEKKDALECEQLTEKLLKVQEDNVYGLHTNVDLILKNHAILYTDYSREGEAAFYYKFFDKENQKPQLVGEHIRDYVLSEDKANLMYTQGDQFNLYWLNFESGKREKITERAGDYYFSKDGKKICYTDEQGDLYIKEKNKEPHKIAENIRFINYFNEDLTKFVYSKEESLYLYHADKEEKIAEDAVILGFFKNGEGYYLTNRKMVPWDSLMEDDVASNSPKKEYLKVLDEEQAYEYGWSVNTLWYFDGEKSHKLTDQYLWYLQSIIPDVTMSGWLPKDRTQIFFREHDANSFQKVKVSELTNAGEVFDKIFYEYQRSAAFFVAIKNKVMPIKDIVAENVSIDSTGRYVYFLKNVSEDYLKGELYKVELSENAVSEPIFVAENVYYARENVLSDGTEIYFTFKDEWIGDLYVDGKKVAEDANPFIWDYDEKTKTLMYFTNWNRGIGHGHLNTYTKGESIFIANNVYDAYFTDSSKLIYLTNTAFEREENNTLYIYDGEKSHRIAQNVQEILFAENRHRDPF